jgi:hypothetical protein
MARYEDGDGLKRSQLYGSVRTFRKRWRWSHGKTARFLAKLRNAKWIAIDTQGGTQASVITIRDYDTYSPVVGQSGTQSGTQSERKVVQEEVSIKKKGSGKRGKPTWLTPYWDAWKERWGQDAEPPHGVMAKVLRPLDTKHGAERTLVQWVAFLKESPAIQYISIPKFAQGFGTWTPQKAQQEMPLLNKPKR